MYRPFGVPALFRLSLRCHGEDKLGEVLLHNRVEERSGGDDKAVFFGEAVSGLESSLGIEEGGGNYTDFILESEEFEVSPGLG